MFSRSDARLQWTTECITVPIIIMLIHSAPFPLINNINIHDSHNFSRAVGMCFLLIISLQILRLYVLGGFVTFRLQLESHVGWLYTG